MNTCICCMIDFLMNMLHISSLNPTLKINNTHDRCKWLMLKL